MRIVLLLLLALGFIAPVQSAADLRDFRNRLGKLKSEKRACLQKSEPQQTKCLESYQKKADKYKSDLAKFKERAQLEEQRRQERRAKLPSSSIEKDITSRERSIEQFSKFVKTGCESKSIRCGSALYQLGNLNYRNEEDDFRIKQTQFEKNMQRWEDRDKRGQEPKPPKRIHNTSLSYFERLLKEYPDYPDLPKVYFRMAFIFSIQGKDNESYAMLEKLTGKYPSHALAVPAFLRMGEHWFLQRKYGRAIEFYDKIPSDYGGTEADLALYHKAECYYNMADFEKAAEQYHDYVVKAERGIIKGELKEEALEFMAACWADLDDGVDIAHKFLKGKGHPWENDVYYQIGMKNKAHDRLEESRKAFRHLLRIDPNYPLAPQADMSIVSTLIVEKRGEEAQKARLDLIERYRPGSAWEQANAGDKENMKEAKKALKQAMFQIPVYFHVNATKKDPKNPDLELLNKAEDSYKAYLQRYQEDSWDVYEVQQNLGSVYHLRGDYAKAADKYNWCANADINKFGRMPQTKKKALLTQPDAAYNRVYMLSLQREKNLKSMDNNEEKAYSSQTTQDYFVAVDDYMAKFGESNSAPDVAYNAALVHYKAKQYSKAITSLTKLRESFPNHKHSNLIRRMLGQSLLEDGQFEESEKVFRELLAKTSPKAEEYKDIELSIASALFKEADVKVKSGDYQGAANLYLKVVESFPTAAIADKALFEAGLQYEKGQDVISATQTLLRVHKAYPKSELRIKSIIKAASIFKENKDYSSAAETFLIIRNKFKSDSLAFNSIGWAAEAYTEGGDHTMAARTYESAKVYFPKHEKTPSFLYNAGRSYEENKDYKNAIRVYNKLGDSYPKSSYALEALFSVPLIEEKQGNYNRAAASYRQFINQYQSDPQKLIRAELAAGRIFDQRLGKKNEAQRYYKGVKNIYKQHGENIPAAFPAEAGYRLGDIYFEKFSAIELNSNKRENAKRLKTLTSILQVAIDHYSYSVEQGEQEWTLRSTMRMGDLFIKMAEITGNEKLQTRDPIRLAGEKIIIKKGLPPLYDKARSLFQKNLDLAREQGIKSKWIDSSGVRFLETFWLTGQVYEEIGGLLANSPIPKGLSPEEVQDYKAALEDKRFEMEQAAKPIYARGVKAALFYYLTNYVKEQITMRLREIDPEAPELQMREYSPQEQMVKFVDDTYKTNKEMIAQIYDDPGLSESKKVSQLKQIEKAARAEIERLSQEIQALNSQQGAGGEE